MEEKHADFIVDGTIDNIIYEIQKTLKEPKDGEIGANESDNTEMVATVVADILVSIEDTSRDEDSYQRFVITPNKRYCLKIDSSILWALAKIIAGILPIFLADGGSFLQIASPSLSAVLTIHDIRGVFKRIPKDDFCILMAIYEAIKEKKNDYIAIAGVEKKLSERSCSYKLIYQRAYGTFCNNCDLKGGCRLTGDSIIGWVRKCGDKYGIVERVEGKLLEIK